MAFTEAELEYLAAQSIGRLATVGPDGTPQNKPVSFRCNGDAGTIDIGGPTMAATGKFRNVERDRRVALVVDDFAAVEPGRRYGGRGIEVRGHAEALRDQLPPIEGFSTDLIRIHPRRIVTWGFDPELTGTRGRDVKP